MTVCLGGRLSRRLALLASTLFPILTPVGASATYSMATGSYVGNGLDSRTISGVGFQPDIVLVKGNTAQLTVVRTSTMAGDSTKQLAVDAALVTDRIQSLTPDGFTVGTNAQVNSNGVTYHWTAFRAAAGDIALGTYTGDGIDNRNITGLGFQPAYVVVMKASSTTARDAVQRYAGNASNNSFTFASGGLITNRIQSFLADGFQVGNDAAVNTNGHSYHYVAWRAVPGQGAAGTYTGNGADNRNITGVGFQPHFVLITGVSQDRVFRPSSLAGDLSLPIPAVAGAANLIQSLSADGFQIGSDNRVNDSGRDYFYVAFQPPLDLGVTKNVNNPNPNPGATITYTVGVSNFGPATATGVTVTDLLPSGVTFVSATPSQGNYVAGTGVWTVGTISASSNATLNITATVNAGTGGQTIVNTATLTAVTPGDTNASNNSASAQITVASVDLAVTKNVNNPTPVEGATIVYTVGVSNLGPATATGVVITDLLPAGVTFVSANPSQGTYTAGTGAWNVGTIAASGNASLTITATVNAGTAGQMIVNTASLTAVTPPDTNAANNSASASITPAANTVDLAVTKTVSNPAPNVGSTIVYAVAVRNLGPATATQIVVTDLLPSGVTFTSSITTQGSYVSGTGVWTVGTLNASFTASLIITASVNAGTAGQTIVNTASLTGANPGDTNSANNSGSASVTVTAVDLAVTKFVNNPTPGPGATIVYTVGVSSTGPNTATGVFLTDLLPAGVTYVSSSPSQGTYSSESGVWNVGTLTASSNASLAITATVNLGTGGQTIVNTASLTTVHQFDTNAANNSASASIVVPLADLAITKSVSNPTPSPGSRVVYTISVSGAGVSEGSEIVVTDILPFGLTFVSSTPSQGSYSPDTGLWTVGSLLLPGEATLEIEVSVDPGTAGETIVNVASVSAEGLRDGDAANDADDAEIEVQGATEAGSIGITPSSYALHAARPNPSRGPAALEFDLPKAGRTSLLIFDVQGRPVVTLFERTLEPGRYAPLWDGRDASGKVVSPGVYFVRLESGEFSTTTKLIRLR